MDYYHLGHCYLAAVLPALQALIEGHLPGVLLYRESKLKFFVKISHEINTFATVSFFDKKYLFRLPKEEDASKTAFNQGLQDWQDNSQVTMTEMIVILEV